jgi:hypothetical protein
MFEVTLLVKITNCEEEKKRSDDDMHKIINVLNFDYKLK